jgi:serine phosphatase RsbU (regulator of sigma subunit)
MEQFRGIKQPIGVFVKNEPYPTGSFQIEKGDRIYLTTDGIADQFGGPDGKKLKSKTIVDFLLSIQQLPMEEHLPQLKSYFLDWKGEEEQLDDVTVLALEW